MVKRVIRFVFLAIGLVWNGGTAFTAPPTSVERVDWVARLIEKPLENHLSLTDFVQTHPEESFAIVKEHWKEITESGGKQILFIAFKAADSPHYLDVLALGMSDDDPGVRFVASDQMLSFSFRTFEETDSSPTYAEWRRQNVMKPQAEIVRENETAFFKRLEASTGTERVELINALMRVDFASTLPLCDLRRSIAKECHALDILAKALGPTSIPIASVVYATRLFQPDEAYLDRVIVPLTEVAVSTPVRFAALSVLSSLQSPRSTEILTKMLREESNPADSWILMQCLSASTDRRLIPTLIGYLEAQDDVPTDLAMQYPLQRLTSLYSTESHSGGWWRLWWRQNHAKLPPEIRDLPIPDMRPSVKRANMDMVFRRKIEWHEIHGDPHKAYWLICPAYVAPATVAAPTSKHRFGLLVALAGGEGNGDDIAAYWSEAAQKALKDNFYVAVPIAPRWSAAQTVPWVTEKTRLQAPGAQFTTESFLNEVVEDVCATAPIDRERCYLHGVAEGGVGVYACSLAAHTPFRGFYILASPFRTAQIPSLSNAKGRRYVIQHSPQDKLSPSWQATAAGEMLGKQGATVKVISVAGDHGYGFAGDPWTPVAEAVAWLAGRK